MTTSTRRRGLATAAAVTLLAITGAACANDSGDSAGTSDEPVSAQRPANGGGKGDTDSGLVATDQSRSVGEAEAAEAAFAPGDAAPGKESAALQAAVISTGNVAMRSDDVGQAIFDVGKIVDRYRGQVEQDTTETDDDGDPMRSRMVLRVPADTFSDVMDDLEDVDVLIASSSNSQDVTTTVLDKRARIAVQRRSIQRIAILLDRAVSIRDIVNIESELSRRTADLAALERQARYLADQTSMSTVSVSIERPREKPAPPAAKDDDKGFFAGLSAGWDALTTFTVGLATVLGALLPWMIVVTILAIPGWPLLRRLRRRDTVPVALPTTSG